jgi:hypothetical protein
MPIVTRVVVVAMLVTMVAEPAWPYIGPGAGLSLIGAFWTLLMAIFAAVGFLVVQQAHCRSQSLGDPGVRVVERNPDASFLDRDAGDPLLWRDKAATPPHTKIRKMGDITEVSRASIHSRAGAGRSRRPIPPSAERPPD